MTRRLLAAYALLTVSLLLAFGAGAVDLKYVASIAAVIGAVALEVAAGQTKRR